MPDAKIPADHAVERTLERLEALDSPDAIAAFLCSVRAFGEPNTTEFCPIALYAIRFSSERVFIYVRTWETKVGEHTTASGVLPPNVRRFVLLFESGAFKWLRRSRPSLTSTDQRSG